MAVKKDLKSKTPKNIEAVKGGLKNAAQRRIAEFGSNQKTKPPGDESAGSSGGKRTLTNS